MATASINSQGSSSWDALEQNLTDFKIWVAEESNAITDNIDRLFNDFLVGAPDVNYVSTSYATFSGVGFTGSVSGSNLHKPNAKITSLTIADSNNRNLTLTGSMTMSSYKVSSIQYSGDEYFETNTGSFILFSSKPQVSKSWSSTIPLDSGPLTINATGTRTTYSETNVITTYKTINLSFGTTSYSVTGLKTTTTGNPLDTDYVALLHSFFSGNDKFTGSVNGDEMKAYDGNDSLDGGSGFDTLNGGLGKDKLTGGLGSDTFVFDGALNAKTNIDTILDFTSGVDYIQLYQTIFRNILGDDALFDVNDILIGSWKKTIDNSSSDAHLIFNAKNKGLYYDADASGSGLAVQFATLTGVASINADDFIIISSER